MIKIEGPRSSIAEMVLYHAGLPFSFKNREYLIPLYDTDRPVVFKAGRQTEKSTTIANIMILDAITYPFFNNLYVSYTQKQVSFFSNIRFQQIINFSPVVKRYFHNVGPGWHHGAQAAVLRRGQIKAPPLHQAGDKDVTGRKLVQPGCQPAEKFACSTLGEH